MSKKNTNTCNCLPDDDGVVVIETQNGLVLVCDDCGFKQPKEIMNKILKTNWNTRKTKK